MYMFYVSIYNFILWILHLFGAVTMLSISPERVIFYLCKSSRIFFGINTGENKLLFFFGGGGAFLNLYGLAFILLLYHL